MTRHRRITATTLGLLAAVGLLMATVSFAPRMAAAQELDELVDEARQFDERIERLETRYLKPAILESRYKLETRFNDARVAYMLEDYSKASLLLVDVVRDPKIERFDSYRQALFLLGDSLYQRRNFLSAKNYLQKLVEMGPGSYYQRGVVRLLEIAAKTESYDGVGELYDRVEGAEVSPAVNYMRGKTLYQQGKPDEARPFLVRAARSDEYAFRARYLRGVSLVAEGRLEEARAVFETITQEMTPETDEETSVFHLGYLALGRIAYEQGDVERAIDLYQRLPRNSEHFDRALYELTWVLVSRKNYKAASRNADIFLYLSNPDPSFIPEVRLLKADLMLRLDRYEEATQAYDNVIETFQPVRETMVRYARGNGDMRGHFREMVERQLSGQDPDYLPDRAREWVDEDEQMKQVKVAIDDVVALRNDIQETAEALEEIEARLNSGSRIKSFPEIAEGMAVAIEAESQLIQLRESLLEREYGLLRPVMNEQEKARWETLRAELAEFQQRYKAVPKTRDEVQQREQHLANQFEQLRDQLDKVAYQIDGQRQQLKSINEYVRKNLEGQMSEKRRERVDQLRGEVRNNIRQLEGREKQLRRKLALTRQKVGVGDRVTKRERELRKKYRGLLAERREFLQKMHGRVGASKQGDLQKIEQARNQLPPAYARLQGFFSKMREIVDEKSADLQRTIEQERQILDKRRQRLRALIDDTKDATTRMALRNYVEVKENFDEIVLRGDVGLIDVAWQRKEGKTDEINQLRENRRAELKALRDSFEEVR